MLRTTQFDGLIERACVVERFHNARREVLNPDRLKDRLAIAWAGENDRREFHQPGNRAEEPIALAKERARTENGIRDSTRAHGFFAQPFGISVRVARIVACTQRAQMNESLDARAGRGLYSIARAVGVDRLKCTAIFFEQA